MDSKSDNVEITMGIESNDITKELLKSFQGKYQEKLEEKMKDSKLVFGSVDLLYYTLHKTTLRRVKSYIEPSEWLRNKRAIINLQNYDDNNCSHYAITATLNH